MNSETRELFIKRYREEKEALEKILQTYEDVIGTVYDYESIKCLDTEYERISDLLKKPSKLLSMIIETATSGHRPEVKCKHEIVYKYFGEDRYKCIDCDARLYLPNEKDLLHRMVLSYKMMNKRNQYLEALLEESSEDAIKRCL